MVKGDRKKVSLNVRVTPSLLAEIDELVSLSNDAMVSIKVKNRTEVVEKALDLFFSVLRGEWRADQDSQCVPCFLSRDLSVNGLSKKA